MLELWRSTLKCNSFRINRNKTGYMHCRFSQIEVEVRINEIAVPNCFRYLELLFQENRMIDEDVTHRIKLDDWN